MLVSLSRVLVAVAVVVSALLAGSSFDVSGSVRVGAADVREVSQSVGTVPAVLADRPDVRGKWLLKTLCAVIVGVFVIASMAATWPRRYRREPVGGLHLRNRPTMRAPPHVRTAL